MRRGTVIALWMLGALVVVFAVALAVVGTDLDRTRMTREDLQGEVDDLQSELDGITGERQSLQAKTDQQLKQIEQLKAELEQLRNQKNQSAASSALPQPAAPAASPPS